MREIKFRAWDIENKSWWRDGDGFAISWDATEIIDDNGIDFPTKDRVVLIQYTGLKDKNGKEIYEGDVLKSLGLLTVEFRNGSFVGRKDKDLWLLSDFELSGKLEDVEIIGNIFENPELL